LKFREAISRSPLRIREAQDFYLKACRTGNLENLDSYLHWQRLRLARKITAFCLADYRQKRICLFVKKYDVFEFSRIKIKEKGKTREVFPESFMKEKLQEIADELSEKFKAPVAVVMESDLGESLKKGDSIECPRNCGQSHPVELSTDADGNETGMLMAVTCGDKSFAVGIDGRRWL
jgi:hypothetical protein